MASDEEQDDHSRSPSADESGSDDGGEDHDMEDKNGQNGGSAKKKNSKDPSRPRRKKARRACYACQRAHLTCGDERPCQRCVKRGLQDSCQDGVRKKAKYLHDAPPEALLPGSANYYSANTMQQSQDQTSPTFPVNASPTVYNARQPTVAYTGFGPTPPLSMSENLVSPAFNTSQSPLATQMQANINVQPTSLGTLAATMPPQTTGEETAVLSGAGFDSNLFDPGDLSQYDFDPTSFNFGNHYGALEFGMLGHLGSRAAGTTPPGEIGNPLASVTAFATPNTLSTSNFGESPVDGNQPFMFNQEGLTDWRGLAQNQSNVRGLTTRATRSRDGQNGPFDPENSRAFSVGVNSGLGSPTASRSPQQPVKQPYRDGTGRTRYGASPSGQVAEQQALQSQNVFNVAGARALNPKRKRGEPSAIYTNVTQPYSYITGFHSLIQLLQKRFQPAKVLRIAKALSSIRPSFMACTRTLNRDDLIFMEKCFQRTLWEYEDFINACGTPTVVCRRTGEIAAAGKEFSILTKWRRDILLGREANLNINFGSSPGGQGQSGTSSRGGANTPRIPESMIDNSRPHPVSLAELLDEDSVVAFYEDFARLAFGDSKGVVTARYKLLKYRTKEEETRLANERDTRALKRKRSSTSHKPGEISGEAGIDDLGEGGKVECSCCWTVKRDIFDLPMMIVMNFLPCI